MNRPLWTRSRQPDPCDAIDLLLSLYSDGMASQEESRRVEAHLPGCASCRKSLLWMQATRRALSGRPVLPPPADLRARISTAIAASSAVPAQVRPTRAFTLRPAYAAAASLTLVGALVGYGLLKPKPPHVLAPNSVKVALNPHPNAVLPKVPSARPARQGGTPSTIVAVSLKPPVKTHPASERLASRVPDETHALPETSAAPHVAPPFPSDAVPKPPERVLAPPVVHPRRLPLKKPVLTIPSARLMAAHPAPEPSLAPTPSLISPAHGSTTNRAVATTLTPPAPVAAASEPPTIIKDDPKPMVAASLPPSNDSRFHTVDLSMVRQYAQANRTNIAHDLNLAGRTAIRTAAHITPTSGMDVEAGKIDITHGDIR